MITVYNENNQAWIDLFTRAWEDLYKDENGNVPEPYRFLTLDDYFAHIGELAQNNKAYLMLPIDEKPFEINANTRNIAVPPDFAKCAGVVGDNFCEIITFTIDRYFDYKDLAGENVQIAVHWKNPNGEEGISQITLIDYDYEYGKIRFGWPLTSNIVCAPGTVQFSVRFYEGKANAQNIIEATYLLNTLVATIPIKGGLSVTDPKFEEQNIADTLAGFVTNSRYLQAVVPVAPTFDKMMGGKNLPLTDDLEGEGYGTLTLYALAISPEGFPITYTWCLSKYDGSDIVLTETSGDYTINEEALIETTDTIPSSKKVYYDEAGNVYSNNLDTFDKENHTYYEKGSSLTINASSNKDIVGKYYVQVQSSNEYSDGENEGVNKSSLIKSNYCEVAKPEEVTFKQDLPEYAFITNENFALKAEANSNEAVYNWHSTITQPESDSIVDATVEFEGQEYSISTPGWYQVQAIVSKNRYEEKKSSRICKVVNPIAAPQITDIVRVTLGEGGSEETTLYEDFDSKDIMPINLKLGDKTTIKVKTNLDDSSNALETEGLTYEWYKSIDYGTPQLIKDATGNSIEIDGVDGATHSYYCVITNYLCGQTKKSETNTVDYTITIV